MDTTDAAIASPHWEACETCTLFLPHLGCTRSEDINLSLHLGDWIVCDDYEPNV